MSRAGASLVVLRYKKTGLVILQEYKYIEDAHNTPQVLTWP